MKDLTSHSIKGNAVGTGTTVHGALLMTAGDPVVPFRCKPGDRKPEQSQPLQMNCGRPLGAGGDQTQED